MNKDQTVTTKEYCVEFKSLIGNENAFVYAISPHHASLVFLAKNPYLIGTDCITMIYETGNTPSFQF